MNLKGERDYQKLWEALEELQLSGENRELAEQYLDMTASENRELLKDAKRQDFSRLDRNKTGKCRDYLAHLKKRGRTEELSRYVRFVTAVGGSTAYFVFICYGWNVDSIKEFLTGEQAAAIRAEGIAWNNYGLKKAAANMGQKNPEILKGAMKLCFHKYANAQTLLAALSLHYTQAERGQGGFFKKVFSGKKPENTQNDILKCLEVNVIDSIPNLFAGGSPSQEEIKELQDFVKKGETGGNFPQRILDIIRGKQAAEYLILLLSGAAFLAMEHSDRLLGFLRLTAAMDMESGRSTTLDVCLEIGGRKWFYDHAKVLEAALPVSGENYLTWCLKNKADEPLGRLVKDKPDVIRKMFSDIPTEQFPYFLSAVEKGNPKLYQELSASGREAFGQKMAQELTEKYDVGKQEAQRYLLGEEELDALYPYLDKWREGTRYYSYDYQRKLSQLQKDDRLRQMYRRIAILEGLCLRTGHFNYLHGTYHKIDRELTKEILALFEEEKLPARYQLEILGGVHDNFYQDKDKVEFINNCVILLGGKRQWEETEKLLSREGSTTVRFLCIRLLDVHWKEYKTELLACAIDGSKQVRELLAAVYESHREWEMEIKAMLASGKAKEREMAALTLGKWGADAYRGELEEALAVEKSRQVRELLESCLGMEGKGKEQKEEESLTELAKEILKGGKKRKVSWAYETPFPEVHRLDGTAAQEDYLTAILVAYADMGTPGVSKQAARLASDLNAKELEEYVNVLFGKWTDTGAEAKKKWVLYAASLHGGESVVPVMYARIKEWPAASRGAMAAEAVRALALNGSSTALLLVDQISRKFKFRQVKTAAGEALAFAAEQLGITREELEDRIIPDLGFDEKMELSFDYGSRSFRVLLTPALELEVYDESGKKLKNLPAPGKKDDPEKAKAAGDEFKLLKKQLKAVAANQKLRLEQALYAERLWPSEKWQELFVKNPVMHQFAISLVWGVYEDGKLKEAFRYMEDGSFNTVEEEEYELPEKGMIGLVHPIELEDLEAWKEQLSDYEVVQPFEQLDRPVYRITEEEKEQRELTRFGGKLLNGLSLSGKLLGQGWYRGSVQDAGGYYTFYREDAEMGVELEFSGCFVGDENEEVTVYGAVFYQAGTVKRGSYVYDTVKTENQYLLSQVSPRYFSETVLQLTRATASSREQLAYPACKER